MKKSAILFICLIASITSFSQSYQFITIIDLETTDVISQGNTGTCWSFSASSFIESEITRKTGKHIDISEMYNVRNTYPKKAWTYVMRQGKAQFSEGGLAHDVMNSASEFGIVPNSVYSGLKEGEKRHNHSKIVDTLKSVLTTYLKDSNIDWTTQINSILDDRLGKNITTFKFEGEEYTPQSFMKMTTINPEDYVNITSFTHQPYYSNFVLNIPDNFSNGNFYNVTLEDMMNVIDNALKNGYTIELDCDVSEKTFSSRHGLAIIPDDGIEATTAFTSLQKEKNITAEFRQQEFENFNTTDDHLMHITGILKDQNGTIYYKVKNSWGKDSKRTANGGYIYMSEAYMKLKTISVMVHKDVLPLSLKSKI